MPQHDWVKSTLGHGEQMCSRCKITNREAAALGQLNDCDVPPTEAAVAAVPRVEKFSIHQPMFSASGDAAGRKYKLCVAPITGRRWVVADQVAAAENIYADGGKGSRGMGGRTLTFELIDGRKVDFIGPWKATAEALLEETGVDVRDTYYTRGICSFELERGKPYGTPDTYIEVLHYDDIPVLGAYDRVEKIAKDLCAQHNRTIYYAYVSKGGGCAFRVEPVTLVDPATLKEGK